jgi:hypothetical protein
MQYLLACAAGAVAAPLRRPPIVPLPKINEIGIAIMAANSTDLFERD